MLQISGGRSRSEIGRYAVDGCITAPADTSIIAEMALPKIPAIAMACRDLRAELLPYYYETACKITVRHHRNIVDECLKFRKQISKQGAWLRTTRREDRLKIEDIVLVVTPILVGRLVKDVRRAWAVEFNVEAGVSGEWYAGRRKQIALGRGLEAVEGFSGKSVWERAYRVTFL